MGWQKREVPSGTFVSLGDGKDQVRQVGGILVRIVPAFYQGKPKDAPDYEFIDKNGEKQMLSGSKSMSLQVKEDDVGHFFKATFEGWGASANGKFKMVTVEVWDDEEPTEKMKAWPGFAEYHGKRAAAQRAIDESPFAGEPDDDELPF